MNKIIPYIFAMLISLSGCAILGNLDQISILGDYSREKDNQHRLVKEINARYDALVKALDAGHIKDYKDKASFLHSFGDPILKKDLKHGQEQWLYRHAIYRLSKDQIIVYFDLDGNLIKWEKQSCPKLF